MEGECGSPESNPASHPLSSDLHLSNNSFTSNEITDHDEQNNMAANDISAEECDKFRADLEHRCSGLEDSPRHSGNSPRHSNVNSPRHNGNLNNSPHHSVQKVDNHTGLSRKDSQSSIEREIIQLNKEMEMIQMECQEIVEAHKERQQRSKILTSAPHLMDSLGRGGGDAFRSPRMVPRMGTRLDYMKQVLATQEGLQSQHGQPFLDPSLMPSSCAGFVPNSDVPLWCRQNSDNLSSGHIAKDMLKPKEIRQLIGVPSGSPAPGEQEKDSNTSNTSAYNTGDSCRSTPLTLELSATSASAQNGHKGSLLSLSTNHNPPPLPKKPSHSDSEKMTQTGAHSSAQNFLNKECASDGSDHRKYPRHPSYQQNHAPHPGVLSKSQSNGSFSENKTSQTPNGELLYDTPSKDSLQDLYAQYADVMYTNRANLEHTIMVQQKLFQQQLMQRSLQEGCLRGSHGESSSSLVEGATAGSQGSPGRLEAGPSTSVGALPQSPSASSHMEWVVKRRADGSRYITRRPIRSKILKERAKKISEERCGITTDDDAVSEMKVGRYWTKEERKRHLEKVREHKKRKQELLKSRMETVKENEEQKIKEPNIVELSHRKMMKHKSKRVFDDFTTVQEMMAHGNREPANAKGYNPLLSVTTV